MNWSQGCESFVKDNVPLARMTSYRVGGPAEWLAEPPDRAALERVLAVAAAAGIPVRMLGHGTNLLVGDAGVKGLVIRLPRAGFGAAERCGERVRVGAGHSLPGLVRWSVTQGLEGLECLEGVPGSVGAALRGNAGGRHGEISNYVRAVWGLERDGTPFEFDAARCGFSYRASGLRSRIVMGCELELRAGDGVSARERLDEILEQKRASQPLAARSAGCVFKNPGQPGAPSAGKLIDAAGLKGARVGSASVSALHANFLICEGQATAGDLVRLIRLVRERVHAVSGAMLELEVGVWGVEPEELVPACWPHAA
jgi:UDP-N-acetylmuramate dehydrogenase